MNPLMLDVVDPFRDWLLSFGVIGLLVWIVLKVLAISVPVIIAVAFYVVWERKLIGWMHVRHGPMYVGRGVLQAFADVFKLLFKEVIQPAKAQPVLYVLAPLITLAPAFAAWAVVPFDAKVVLSNANWRMQIAAQFRANAAMRGKAEGTQTASLEALQRIKPASE